jgi:CRISPR-associated protein Cas2
MRYVIAYDISDDRPRVRLANYLLDYGDRVQGSVFEADLSTEDVQEILAYAEKLLSAGDSLLLYPLCRACRSRIQLLGPPPCTEVEAFCVL